MAGVNFLGIGEIPRRDTTDSIDDPNAFQPNSIIGAFIVFSGAEAKVI